MLCRECFATPVCSDCVLPDGTCRSSAQELRERAELLIWAAERYRQAAEMREREEARG